MVNRKYMLESISDLSKEAYGFRVAMAYDELSYETLCAVWNKFMIDSKQRQQKEAAMELRAFVEWSTHMAAMIDSHKISRAEALHRDMDNMSTVDNGVPNVGHYCFLLGIPMDLEDRLKEILNEG